METYFQFEGGSCMTCHDLSNKQGRDFVMFVTIDAFRPSVHAPADFFAAKMDAAKTPSPAQDTPLSSDPVVKSLVDFFEAAQRK